MVSRPRCGDAPERGVTREGPQSQGGEQRAEH